MEKLFLTNEIMYKALLDKDSQFEGQFFVGVRTTGIFCRPTCRARKPKKDNVEFFKNVKDALSNGYRPCKICNPLNHFGEAPDEIKLLLSELHENPSQKISDYTLVQKGFEPNRIRRWFMKNHGMTFHAYQRFLRINNAFNIIQDGNKVIEAVYNSGYESVSGFQHSFKKITSHNPSESKEKTSLSYMRFTTPIGLMIAVGNDDGICLLDFSDRRMLETELNQIRKHFRTSILPGENVHLKNLKIQLEEYFNGTRKNFDIPLITPGTTFQNDVWKILRDISYGHTRSYKNQAIALGKPQAVRAVANANGCNRISIVIPCHRVIGEDGQLSGYGGGLWRKQWLLEHERKNSK